MYRDTKKLINQISFMHIHKYTPTMFTLHIINIPDAATIYS